MATLFRDVFSRRKSILAMIHVFEGGLEEQRAQALEDLNRLQPYVDGVIVENYDIGYLDANRTTVEMAMRIMDITATVVAKSSIPVGVNLLPNDYWQALAIAASTGARFIQLDHVTGEFVGCQSVDPDDYRMHRQDFPNVIVLGGVQPKYYELVDPLTPIAQAAATAVSLADAIVVTGVETGRETSLDDLRIVREAIGEQPLLVGSGLSAKNARAQLSIADGAIVGSAFKPGGVRPGEPIDVDLVRELVREVSALR